MARRKHAKVEKKAHVKKARSRKHHSKKVMLKA